MYVPSPLSRISSRSRNKSSCEYMKWYEDGNRYNNQQTSRSLLELWSKLWREAVWGSNFRLTTNCSDEPSTRRCLSACTCQLKRGFAGAFTLINDRRSRAWCSSPVWKQRGLRARACANNLQAYGFRAYTRERVVSPENSETTTFGGESCKWTEHRVCR